MKIPFGIALNVSIPGYWVPRMPEPEQVLSPRSLPLNLSSLTVTGVTNILSHMRDPTGPEWISIASG
jgi:hypothetical protein